MPNIRPNIRYLTRCPTEYLIYDRISDIGPIPKFRYLTRLQTGYRRSDQTSDRIPDIRLNIRPDIRYPTGYRLSDQIPDIKLNIRPNSRCPTGYCITGLRIRIGGNPVYTFNVRIFISRKYAFFTECSHGYLEIVCSIFRNARNSDGPWYVYQTVGHSRCACVN